MIWMKDLLLAFGGSEQTIPYAQDYLNIVVPGTLLTSLSFGFNAVMRASGYPKKAMFTMLIGGDNQCDTRSYFHFLAGYGD